jgi:hypothetical protein
MLAAVLLQKAKEANSNVVQAFASSFDSSASKELEHFKPITV